ncbi:MAG: hypothetical protein GMKNLPBB_01100 [Myxococcota bacterium]|nr:hypothetical protein [Myxococcota bacterium]
MRLWPWPIGLVLLYYTILYRPGSLEWERVLNDLAPEVQAGDLVITAPVQSFRSIVNVPDLPLMAPIHGQYFDTRGLRKIWQVSDRGVTPGMIPNSINPAGHGGWMVTAHPYEGRRVREQGNLVITEFEPPKHRLGEHLRELVVEVEQSPGGPWSQCLEYNGKYHCGTAPWHYVGETFIPVHEQQTQCIWAHPYAGRNLRIRHPEWPLSKRFFLYTMFGDPATRGDIAAPVRLTIRVGNYIRREILHHPFPGTRVHVLEMPEEETPASAPLIIDVFSEREGKAHFCFALEN